MGQIRILVIDDHPLVRQGLKELLRLCQPSLVFAEASNAREALRLLDFQTWNLVLLDMSLPDEDGLQLLTEIKQIHPSLPVLVVSMHREEDYAVRVLKAGAAGFVSKGEAYEKLCEAVKQVLEGKKYVNELAAEQLAQDLANDSQASPGAMLSGRELQVINFLGEGKSVKQIAFDLGLSVKTISTYRARVLNKLRLSTTSDLIRYAVREGLVSL
jgi:two-component system invasion response regulator UvrY